MQSADNLTVAKPFLRWAGGKSWLVKHLAVIKHLKFNTYHEPFLGGGAAFFYLTPKNAILSDLNKELIETYKEIQINAKGVIKHLKSFSNTEEEYYKIRNREYKSASQRAARFIFLNQTSFNGIYRVNLNGVYNVPYGFRDKNFLDEANLFAVQRTLSTAKIQSCDFYSISENVRKRDLVFLDPPYTVSHNNNGFIKYNEKIFSLEDQKRLSDLIDFLRSKGAYYILTNAAHKTIDAIFEKGDRKIVLDRASLIGGINAQRGQTKEFIFTNTLLGK